MANQRRVQATITDGVGRHAGTARGTLQEVLPKVLRLVEQLLDRGGVARAGNLFLSAIRESIFSRSPHLATIDLTVRFSELMEKGGPTGAGVLILEEIFSFPRFQETLDRHLG